MKVLNRQFNTFILDLDGPLLDGQHRHYDCYRDILEKFGFVPLPKEEYWSMKRARIDRRVLLSKSHAEHFYHQFLDTWLALIETRPYLKLDILQPNVKLILTEWGKAGMRLIVMTMRNDLLNLTWQLDSLGLSPLFDKVVAVSSSGNKAESVKAILSQDEIENSLWFGDTEVDVDSAKALGIPIVALSSGLRTEDYLQSLHPDLLYENLQDFFKFIGQIQASPPLFSDTSS